MAAGEQSLLGALDTHLELFEDELMSVREPVRDDYRSKFDYEQGRHRYNWEITLVWHRLHRFMRLWWDAARACDG